MRANMIDLLASSKPLTLSDASFLLGGAFFALSLIIYGLTRGKKPSE
jgi:hypothetical protein